MKKKSDLRKLARKNTAQKKMKSNDSIVTLSKAKRLLRELKARQIELQNQNEQLRQSQEQYRKQFEEAIDPIMLADAKTGIILDCNIAATLLVGREKNEIIGMHQGLLHVPENTVAGYSKTFKRHAGGETLIMEDKVLTKSGKVKDVSISASNIILNGRSVIQGIFRDITESKLAQEKLQKILIDLSLAQRIAHVGSWSWDSETDKVIWSEELYRITGLDPKNAAPKYAELSRFYTLESWKKVRQTVEKALSDGTAFEMELEMVRPSGEHRWTLTFGQSIGDAQDHQSKGLFGVVFDITERKKADEILRRDKDTFEKLVGERTRELLETQKKLEDAKRLSDIGMLASTIAHELRNPLGVIRIAAYNIKKKKKDGSLDTHLANIDKKIAESDQIIRNLLSYSNIKMPNYAQIDVSEALNTCISQCKDKYSQWNVVVKTTFKNLEKKNIIEADYLHITELFLNLLDNAYQAFLDKNGSIEITVDYDPAGNKLNMIFSDNGVGIEYTDVVEVFKPFFTTKAKGIGLGLTVCKQVVVLHNGRIHIKSQKGSGTQVFVNLPVKKM